MPALRDGGSRVVIRQYQYLPMTKEKLMSTKVGLWIDHRKALVVTVTDKDQVVKLIISAVEKQARRSSTSRHSGRFESQMVKADDSRQRALTGHLGIYYDAVIASIRSSDSILIFGPGEAKGELQKRLRKLDLGGRVVGVETVDKMTDHQIAAKVRQYFKKR
jgi:hypothetical protein